MTKIGNCWKRLIMVMLVFSMVLIWGGKAEAREISSSEVEEWYNTSHSGNVYDYKWEWSYNKNDKKFTISDADSPLGNDIIYVLDEFRKIIYKSITGNTYNKYDDRNGNILNSINLSGGIKYEIIINQKKDIKINDTQYSNHNFSGSLTITNNHKDSHMLNSTTIGNLSIGGDLSIKSDTVIIEKTVKCSSFTYRKTADTIGKIISEEKENRSNMSNIVCRSADIDFNNTSITYGLICYEQNYYTNESDMKLNSSNEEGGYTYFYKYNNMYTNTSHTKEFFLIKENGRLNDNRDAAGVHRKDGGHFSGLRDIIGDYYRDDVSENYLALSKIGPQTSDRGDYSNWEAEKKYLSRSEIDNIDDSGIYTVSIVRAKNTYTLNYNTDGGNAIASKRVTYGDKIDTLPYPSRKYYDFVKWVYADGRQAAATDTMPASDTTIKALWNRKTVNVTLDPDGGTISKTSYTFNLGDTYAIPTPTKDGYEFTGWQNEVGQTVDETTVVEKETAHTLKATWRLLTRVLTFNPNGGELVGDKSMTVNYGSEITTFPNATKAHCKLLGWYTAAEGGVKIDKIVVKSNTTLYAQFEPIVANIVFDAKGGEADFTSKKINAGEKFKIPGATYDGYTFDGWFLEDGTKITADSIVPDEDKVVVVAKWTKKGSKKTDDKKDDGKSSDDKTTDDKQSSDGTKSSDTTKTDNTKIEEKKTEDTPGVVTEQEKKDAAVAEAVIVKKGQVKVILNCNGGKIGKKKVVAVAKTKDEAIGKLNNPKLTKYIFNGWYTKRKGGKKVTKTTKYSKDVTLYAHWTKIKIKRVVIANTNSPAKGKVFIKAKTQKSVTGYQVQYGTNKKFKKAKKKFMTGHSTTLTFKSGQRCYIRVRAYKKDSAGKKIFGKWSLVRTGTVR